LAKPPRQSRAKNQENSEMGKGRPPKSAAVHAIEKPKLYGELAERAEIESALRAGEREMALKPPRGLSREAKREWRMVAEILRMYGLLIPANAIILERLARNLADYRVAVRHISDEGIVVKSRRGGWTYNPYWGVKNKLEDKIHRDLVELGLSATGIARLGSLAVRARKTAGDVMDMLVD